jgi:outer membrane protein
MQLVMRKLLVIVIFALPAVIAQAAGSTQNLIDLYREALLNDPRWAAARSANTAAQEFSVQGKALLLPTVSAKAGASHSDTHIQYTGTGTVFRNGGPESFDSSSYGLDVSQPIFNLANFVSYQQSKVEVTLADKQLMLAQQDLMLRATQAYFDVLLAQDKIDLIGAQKSAIVRQLEQAKANFEVGTATITDVDDAQARYDLTVAREIAFINELEVKKRAIQAVIGKMPQTLASVRTDLKTSLPEPGDMEKWVEMALQNNLDLNIQQQTFEIASQEVRRANAGHLPTLYAVGSYTNAYADGGVSGFGNDLQDTTIGLRLQIPIYQGGAVSSQVREAVANQQKAQDDVETARRKAEFDAREAYLNIVTGVAEVKANEQAVVSSLSQVDSTKLAYDVGIRTTVDVLNAEQQYFTTKRDLLQSRYLYLVNTIKLKSAAGLLSETDLAVVNQQLLPNQ